MASKEKFFRKLGEFMKILMEGVADVIAKDYSRAIQDLHKARSLVATLKDEGLIDDEEQEGITIILDGLEACFGPKGIKRLGERLPWWFMFNVLKFIEVLVQRLLDIYEPEDFYHHSSSKNAK